MSKFYDKQHCVRKADQHWEMAGCARQDGDKEDELKHTDLARMWLNRARLGGYCEGQREEE